MENWKKTALKFALAFLYGAICMIIGWYCHKPITEKTERRETVKVSTIVKTDTVEVTKTVTKLLPVEIEVQKELSVTNHVADGRRDTLFREVLTYEQPIENDSVEGKIRAVVSGYDARLDTLTYELHIPYRTVEHTTERTVEEKTVKKKRWGFHVGPGVGLGYDGKRFAPYVGVGLQWGLNL